MIELIGQELHVSGMIDYNNAEEYYQQGIIVLNSHLSLPIVVNLSKLEQGSTLALAVLIQLLRQTPKANGLVFKAVPEKMMKIIQACHLGHDLQLVP